MPGSIWSYLSARARTWCNSCRCSCRATSRCGNSRRCGSIHQNSLGSRRCESCDSQELLQAKKILITSTELSSHSIALWTVLWLQWCITRLDICTDIKVAVYFKLKHYKELQSAMFGLKSLTSTTIKQAKTKGLFQFQFTHSMRGQNWTDNDYSLEDL